MGISYVYALPFFKEPGLAHSRIGRLVRLRHHHHPVGHALQRDQWHHLWRLAGLGNGVGTGSRPDLVGSAFAVTSAQKDSAAAGGVFGPLYYNPGAFAVPVGLTYGNVGRNTLYYPGRTNFDFGLFKRFQIKEKAAFEFRWETFNLFNHTQYNGIDSALACDNPGSDSCLQSSTFMHLNSAHAARRMQFGLRFQF